MLAYILALAVALGSLGIYLAAFFFPEIHRKNDFYWSGVGLFYALILWVCAGRITGGLLLGQVAGVALLGWSVTQTLQLRRQLTPSLQQTELPSAEQVKNTVGEQISKLPLPQRLFGWGKRVGGSANVAKNRIQELSDRSPSQNQPETATTTTPTSAGESATAPPAAEVAPNVQVIDRRTPVLKSEPSPSTTTATTEAPAQTKESPLGAEPAPAAEAPTQIKESPLGAEPAINTYQPAGPDMPGASGKEPIPVEQIAPEVELAPPAEPLGSGDPEDRQNPPPPPEAMAAVPIDPTQTAPAPVSPSESTSDKDVPELKRPNPPDPEIVAEAIEDAQEKHQEAHPPESTDHNSP
ncbi:MAG TPA: hypothetical protein DEV81_07790 [Cyanobacteria bacterium UBA11049]|nr:hypothetical protein [Cyanobacteria bacterium UBA11049]